MSRPMLANYPFQGGVSENPSAKKVWVCVLLNPAVGEGEVDSVDGYESILTQNLETSSLGHLGPTGPTNNPTKLIPYQKGL